MTETYFRDGCVSKLLEQIDWREHYMRWHDGDPDYKLLR